MVARLVPSTAIPVQPVSDAALVHAALVGEFLNSPRATPGGRSGGPVPISRCPRRSSANVFVPRSPRLALAISGPFPVGFAIAPPRFQTPIQCIQSRDLSAQEDDLPIVRRSIMIIPSLTTTALSVRALVISYGATAEAALIEVANACFAGLRRHQPTLLRLRRAGLRHVRPGVDRRERAQAAPRPQAQSARPRARHPCVPALAWLTDVSLGPSSSDRTQSQSQPCRALFTNTPGLSIVSLRRAREAATPARYPPRRSRPGYGHRGARWRRYADRG